MTVPITTVYKDDLPEYWENDIRFSGKFGNVKTIPISA